MDVFGLLGNPVGHSLSPPMHEAAYAELGMDARYVTFEPEPEALPAALEGAAALGIAGLNVTIPFKRDVLELVEPDDLAARIGAVNTVDLSDGPPTGHNTDAEGVVRAFERHGVALDGTAVVVGAGGAGRAVAFALADAGMEIRVANRTVERAEELAGAVAGASAHPLSALPGLLADASVLVNATSVGMEGTPPRCRPRRSTAGWRCSTRSTGPWRRDCSATPPVRVRRPSTARGCSSTRGSRRSSAGPAGRPRQRR